MTKSFNLLQTYHRLILYVAAAVLSMIRYKICIEEVTFSKEMI